MLTLGIRFPDKLPIFLIENMALPAKFKVLLIDAQNDFSDALMPDGGADGMGMNFGKGSMGKLPVMGAKNDMGRITNFLNKYKDAIQDVYASMDTHTLGHIGHMFWRNKTTKLIAGPSTVFTIKDDKIVGMYDKEEYEVNVGPKHQDAMDKYAKAYITAVQTRGKAGRNLVNTWNIHCLEGSVGWNIAPNVKMALDSMSAGKVHYFIKGQNQLAEMYSIFAAEAPYEDIIADPANGFTEQEKEIIGKYVYNPRYPRNKVNFDAAITQTTLIDTLLPSQTSFSTNSTNSNNKTNYPSFNNPKYNLQTTFNKELFDALTGDDLPIIVCGEALSHCVQFSARDLIDEIKKQGKPNKVYILQGGSSAVDLGPDSPLTALFKTSANKFLMDMKTGKDMSGESVDTGLLVLYDDGTIVNKMDGGRRRRRAAKQSRKTRRHRKAKKSKKTRKH
jgi:nicotinamidase-related amidase